MNTDFALFQSADSLDAEALTTLLGPVGCTPPYTNVSTFYPVDGFVTSLTGGGRLPNPIVFSGTTVCNLWVEVLCHAELSYPIHF